MNPQSKRGKRRSSVQKEEPTKRRAEEGTEKKEPDVVSSSGDSDDEEDEVPVFTSWDDIGKEEKEYLESTRKELHELIMKRETFESGVAEKSTEKLEELTESLLTFGKVNIEQLQLLMPDQTEREAHERSRKGRYVSLITFQHRRLKWMIGEVFRRCRKRKSLLIKETRRTMTLQEENGILRIRLEKMSRELEEHQRGLVSREKSKRDVAVSTEAVSTETVSTETVSTETEVPEVEMLDDQALSAPQGIPQNMVGTLEAMIEKKIGELLSRVGLSVEKEREDTVPAITRGKTSGSSDPGDGTATSRSTRLWSEVAAKSGVGKSQSVRDSIPANKEGGKAGAQVAQVAGKNPRPIRKGRGGKERKRREWPKLPQTAAVVLTAPVGKESSCTELMRRARQEISIEDLDIPHLDIRRSRTGGYILGVPGQSPDSKADRLAAGLERLAEGMGVRVTRPTKKADIRVTGMDESATPEEVVAAISRMTGCHSDSIRSGKIQWTTAGTGSIWLQCPLEAAIKAAKTGRAKVGWANASIEMLKARPLRCFRCLEVGHIGVQCTSKVERALRCFRCGAPGHKAGECREGVPRCPLCMDTGRPHNHVLGGPGCYVPPRRQTRAETSAVVTPSGVT